MGLHVNVPVCLRANPPASVAVKAPVRVPAGALAMGLRWVCECLACNGLVCDWPVRMPVSVPVSLPRSVPMSVPMNVPMNVPVSVLLSVPAS
eukprot:7234668-Alexandrium_andersonii.AAC.1